jgi:protocatechuate 3,4-dioxygenase beta subunit
MLCVAAPAQSNAQLRALIPAGPFRIAGTVVGAKAGNPLARCRVTITDVKRQDVQSIITGEDGHFEFHVPAGKYSLEGEKRGFIGALYDQHDQFSTAIVTGADLDSENLALRLAPVAVLSGKVVDEVGEPVRTAQVTIYREDHSQGVSRITRFRGTTTDDQGRYEVTPLDPGTYFVSAKAFPWYAVHPMSNGSTGQPSQIDSSLDVAYPITFYGDATETDDAVPIPIRGGDHLEADIRLSPVPALRIILHVPQEGADNGPPPTLQKPVFDAFEPAEIGGFRHIAPGTFELTGIAGGRYTLRMADSSGHIKEPAEVNFNGGGELDLSSAKSTSRIKAAVQLAGWGSLPSQLTITLAGNKGGRVQTNVDAKGEANFSDVIPGKYDVLATSPGQSFSVVRIGTDAGTISGRALTVPPSASLTISLSVMTGSVKVEGFAKRSGKPVAGAMVLLVPKDAAANRDCIRRDQTDLDGAFSLRNVVPGAYTIVAIENGWDLDWSQPAELAAYLKRGQTVDVGSHGQTEMRLADAVDVQLK